MFTHVSVPLRGVGCVGAVHACYGFLLEFPSPYGAWVVSVLSGLILAFYSFRPLTGRGLCLTCACVTCKR